MRLLAITNNPERASFRQRIGVYIEHLQRSGIEVDVARLPKRMAGRIRFFRKAREYDGVFLHKKVLNPIDAFFLRKYARKIIYNYDDAVMFSDKRPEQYSRSHFVGFRRSVRISDMVIIGSAYLGSFAEPFSDNVNVLPIGLDIGNYKADINRQDTGTIKLVWIGSASTISYLADIADVIEEVGKKYDNIALKIIGDEFIEFENLPVEKCKWSKDSRADDLCSCDIGLAPLPENPFTRGKCSFKVLEYSASGLAIVASPVGTNTVHVVEGVTGFLAGNKNQWVEKISQLVENKQLRDKMGQAGIEHARKFDVSVVGERLAGLICNCLKCACKGD